MDAWVASWLMNPLVGGLVFLGLAYGLYWLGGRLQATGQDSPGKHLPYACGEDLGLEESRFSYQRFFRLALMFVVVHMATLVVAFLPTALEDRVLATVYMLGVAVCVDALVRRGE